MTTGTYVLVLDVERRVTRDVGALGTLTFPAETHAYIGSALGASGFSRVDRHRRLARGEDDTRHWHIDHLLTAAPVSIAAVHTLEEVAAECELARTLPGDPVQGFGCTDCGCDTHLFAGEETVFKRAVDRFQAEIRSG